VIKDSDQGLAREKQPQNTIVIPEGEVDQLTGKIVDQIEAISSLSPLEWAKGVSDGGNINDLSSYVDSTLASNSVVLVNNNVMVISERSPDANDVTNKGLFILPSDKFAEQLLDECVSVHELTAVDQGSEMGF